MRATTLCSGPLRELPLELFLASAVPVNPLKQGLKRSRAEIDPSGTPLSPAKKRVLRDEGLVSPSPSGAGRAPGSPDRRLDFAMTDGTKGPQSFGLALEAVRPHARASTRAVAHPSPSSGHLAPSPDLERTSVPVGDEIDAFFSSPSRPIRKTGRVALGNLNPETPAAPLPTHDTCHDPASMPPPASLLILRELPPSPDRTSIHYPGFDIYRDTHITIPTERSIPASTVPAASPSSDDDDAEYGDENIPSPEEQDKENLIPRRPKNRKAATIPADAATNAGLLLLSPAKGASAPVSPIRGKAAAGATTPRSLAAFAEEFLSPTARRRGKTPVRDRKSLRRLMEDEADEDASI